MYCIQLDQTGIEVNLLKIPLRMSKGINTMLVRVETRYIDLNRVEQKKPRLFPDIAQRTEIMTK